MRSGCSYNVSAWGCRGLQMWVSAGSRVRQFFPSVVITVDRYSFGREQCPTGLLLVVMSFDRSSLDRGNVPTGLRIVEVHFAFCGWGITIFLFDRHDNLLSVIACTSLWYNSWLLKAPFLIVALHIPLIVAFIIPYYLSWLFFLTTSSRNILFQVFIVP